MLAPCITVGEDFHPGSEVGAINTPPEAFLFLFPPPVGSTDSGHGLAFQRNEKVAAHRKKKGFMAFGANAGPKRTT